MGGFYDILYNFCNMFRGVEYLYSFRDHVQIMPILKKANAVFVRGKGQGGSFAL